MPRRRCTARGRWVAVASGPVRQRPTPTWLHHAHHLDHEKGQHPVPVVAIKPVLQRAGGEPHRVSKLLVLGRPENGPEVRQPRWGDAEAKAAPIEPLGKWR